MFTEQDFTISERNYKRTRLVLDILSRFLKVHFKVHHLSDQFEEGDIFLFNHFARFETFIPQYLIYEETGKTCRSLAAPELFREDAFGRYLRSIGAVPTDFPPVIHFLACEINRGRKAVIFPEGAMIKDRRVLGPKGRFRIYSRSIRAYRKPHTGAAVIALYAQQMRDLFLLAYQRRDQERLEEMAAMLRTPDVDQALEIASRPVRIVPGNITFHPLRGDENFLSKVAERLGAVKNDRVEEELIIEGNILFKDTDMDIRLGNPMAVPAYFGRTDRLLLRSRYHLQKPKAEAGLTSSLITRLEMVRSEILSERIMCDYMKTIYSLVTVNLAHLCAEIIYQLLKTYRQRTVSAEFLARVLYLSIKKLQRSSEVFLHRGLLHPDRYGSLLTPPNRDLRDCLLQAEAAGLIRKEGEGYSLLPALEEEYDFDEIRIRNFLRVRYNEIRPLPVIEKTVREVLTRFDTLNTPEKISDFLFDDDTRSYERDLGTFCGPRYEEINREEHQIRAGGPFFLLPPGPGTHRAGALLIHGFTASPAEMRPLGEFLAEQGFPAYGVRLKGHGTSPCDLDVRTLHHWYASLFRGWEALRARCAKVFVVGFSMGGSLALKLAADKGAQVAGVVSISTPIRIRDKNIVFARLVDQINKLVAALPYLDGIKRFKKGSPENPDINYRNIPIRAIREFKELFEETPGLLPEVYAPALVLQAKGDTTVDPESARIIYRGLASRKKRLVMVDADRHVIVLEKGSQVHREVLQFLMEHAGDPAAVPSG